MHYNNATRGIRRAPARVVVQRQIFSEGTPMRSERHRVARASCVKPLHCDRWKWSNQSSMLAFTAMAFPN